MKTYQVFYTTDNINTLPYYNGSTYKGMEIAVISPAFQFPETWKRTISRDACSYIKEHCPTFNDWEDPEECFPEDEWKEFNKYWREYFDRYVCVRITPDTDCVLTRKNTVMVYVPIEEFDDYLDQCAGHRVVDLNQTLLI